MRYPPIVYNSRMQDALIGALLIVLMMVSVFCATGLAQLYSGTVTGLVTDPSDAVIPSAQIKLVNQQNGFSFTTITNSVGQYRLLAVPPGTYTLSVSAAGFRSESRTGILVAVNQNVAVNFSLQVGVTTQTVQVRGMAPMLATQDATIGQTVDRRFINDLPLIDRSVMDLALLAPGITNQGYSGYYSNDFISNGSRNATSDLLIDGVSTTNYEQNSGIQVPLYTPSIDAVQEFTVDQGNFSAKYGFGGSTIINMVTRSGTNQFHGSAYDFVRNNAFDANDFFSNAAGGTIPPIHRNDFGGTLGGPIRRDKTFFFFDYEGTRESTMDDYTGGVPSVAERNGDFSELCGYAGGTFSAQGMCSNPNGQLWDPYTGVYNASLGGPVRSGFVPFNDLATYTSPGNPNLSGTAFQLPSTPGNLIDPVASKFMSFYPSPNLKVGTPGYNPYFNWFGSSASPDSNNQFDLKVDQRFRDGDVLTAKYSQQWFSSPSVNCFKDIADPCSYGPQTSGAHLAAVNYTHSFGPALLWTVSLGVTRATSFSHGIAADYPSLDQSNTLGMPAYMDRSGIRQLPQIFVSGYGGFGASGQSIGTQSSSYQHEGQQTQDLSSTLNWIKGQHDLAFGFDGRLHRINYTQPGVPGGIFAFDFTGTSEFPFSGGGDGMASFLTGVTGPGGYGAYEIPNFVSTQSFEYAGYVQDDWKARKNLTLNLGLRYETSTPRTERYNHMNSLDPNVVSPLKVPGFGVLHGGEIFMTPANRSNYGIDWTSLGPRFGFAYEPIKNTVIRGGYGIYYLPNHSGAAGTGAIGYQGYDEITPWITTYRNDGATPWGRLSNPFPNGGPIYPPGSSLGLLNDVGFGAMGPIPSIDTITPYEQTWSFGIQRELPGSILVDANYVGKKGTHLYYGNGSNLDFLGSQIEQYSPGQIAQLLTYVPNPFYGIITNAQSSLSSQYVQQYQLELPFPQFTSFTGDTPPWGNSIYNAFQLRVEKRFSHGLQFLTTYTWSKSFDDTSAGDGNVNWLGGLASLQDPNNREAERSLSSFDIPQQLQFSYVYQLPVGHGKRLGSNMPALLNAIVGGWQTNGIWTFAKGQPIALGLQGGQSLPTYGGQRPDLVGALRCASGPNSQILTQYFANPQVVETPAPFTLGTAARTIGTCRQPGQANASLSIFKEFSLSKLREGAHLEFRAEAYNAFNHPQFGGPDTTLNSGSFGQIFYDANSPREVQLALKLYW